MVRISSKSDTDLLGLCARGGSGAGGYGTERAREVAGGGTQGDVIGQLIGDIGRWQCRLSIMMSLLKMPIAWFQLGIVFLAPPTKFWCRQPPEYANVTVARWLDMVEVRGAGAGGGGGGGQCVMWDPYVGRAAGAVPVRCPWGHEYDRSVTRSSIITEWDLVCGREHLVELAQMSLMLGVLVGNVLFGLAADRIGRRPCLLAAVAVQSGAGTASALAPGYAAFVCARFVMAVANGGTMVVSFVMCMESVGGRWRTIVAILYQIPFGLGNALMSLAASCLREWRQLQLALSIASAGFLVYWWFVPESPRWLVAVGRVEEAALVLESAAAENRRPASAVRRALDVRGGAATASRGRTGPRALVTGRAMRTRTCLLAAHWMLAGVSFYGFSQYMGQLTGADLYVTVAAGGLIALPGTLLCVLIVSRHGRRPTIACSLIFTATCYASLAAVPAGGEWPRVALAALGVVGMSVSMPAVYLFTGELYPTVVRNAGVGACVMCSRIGSMIAPLVVSLSSVASCAPPLLLGALVLVEAMLVLPLPETRDTVLPDTVSQAEQTAEAERE